MKVLVKLKGLALRLLRDDLKKRKPLSVYRFVLLLHAVDHSSRASTD